MAGAVRWMPVRANVPPRMMDHVGLSNHSQDSFHFHDNYHHDNYHYRRRRRHHHHRHS